MSEPSPMYGGKVQEMPYCTLDRKLETRYEISLNPIYTFDENTKETICTESVLGEIYLERILTGEKFDGNEVLEYDKERNVIICKYYNE